MNQNKLSRSCQLAAECQQELSQRGGFLNAEYAIRKALSQAYIDGFKAGAAHGLGPGMVQHAEEYPLEDKP